MCRLFALHAGRESTSATFWLLHAPDSLARQSHANPDGAGIGVFDSHGRPVIDKQPLAAFSDRNFVSGAKKLKSTTFLAHVRYSSGTPLSRENTHPFEMDGRLFAHNGDVQGLPVLDERLEAFGVADLVRGQTDSERVFALITAEIRRSDGDVAQGIVAAVSWIAATLPVYSANIIVTTPTDVWALRYPSANELHLLDRPTGGTGPGRALDARSDRIRAQLPSSEGARIVVIASERMDDDPAWGAIGSGELVHIDTDLHIDRRLALPRAPAHPVSRADLTAHVARAQQPR